MKPPSAIPMATYRLQFNREFTFRDAAALVPYLSALGISHCYASPYLRARPGSMHGYDIIDHNSLNPEIGSPEDYDLFVHELHRHGMGQILDIVPNHMGVMGSDNHWWLDVLENGRASQFADFFDIDWKPIKQELHDKILVPVLAEQYGSILEKGELRLCFDAQHGEFSIFYAHHRFPIDPKEYTRILLWRQDQGDRELWRTDNDLLELQSIATALGHLPGRTDVSDEEQKERIREKEVQKARLGALTSRAPSVRSLIERNVQELNGSPGDAKSFDGLHDLIKAQVYRLAHWRVAADDINYRRFFDINDLAALRMERESVFAATHGFVFDLIARGKVNGLRIDHPDGLIDPAEYLHRLRAGLCQAHPPDQDGEQTNTYVIVEKILTNDEQLDPEWPVCGTTGYDFANLVSGLLVDKSTAVKMERNYRAFIGKAVDFQELVYRSKKLIFDALLASELNTLANGLSRIALSNRHTCDFTLNALRRALAEIIANFPVYRTYGEGNQISDKDRPHVERAVAMGKGRSRASDVSVFDFIQRLLLMDAPAERGRSLEAIQRFQMKLQQVTSAVMAKGLEDTALYRYHRLISLNDVGGNPLRFGVTVGEFHRANAQRAERWPNSLVATSTHDSKRSEDVRARIAVLSELPALFRLNVGRWARLNRYKRSVIDGQFVPSRNDEYLFYQTLIGALPFGSLGNEEWAEFSGRIERYMLKATREAKEFTSWANVNAEYEAATVNFVRAALERSRRNRFLDSFYAFHSFIAQLGMLNSLSQTLLKLTAPGVPDFYQGNELWDFSLADPDNRRHVNYARRREALRSIKERLARVVDDASQFCRELIDTMQDGRIKLYLAWKTLCYRNRRPDLYRQGVYRPLDVRGAHADRVCAFGRLHGDEAAVTVAPRLWAALLDGAKYTQGIEVWKDTRIELPGPPFHPWRDVFTNQVLRGNSLSEISLTDALKGFPIALLVGERLPVSDAS